MHFPERMKRTSETYLKIIVLLYTLIISSVVIMECVCVSVYRFVMPTSKPELSDFQIREMK